MNWIIANKTVLIWILVIVVVLLIIYYIIKNRPQIINNITNILPDKITGNKTTNPVTGFPLREGSHGTEVKNLQHVFNVQADKLGLPQLVEDGIWGPKTTKIVVKLFPSGQITEDEYNAYVFGIR